MSIACHADFERISLWVRMSAMQRVTVVLDDRIVSELDRIGDQRGYQNRSEAIRDLTRTGTRRLSRYCGLAVRFIKSAAIASGEFASE